MASHGSGLMAESHRAGAPAAPKMKAGFDPLGIEGIGKEIEALKAEIEKANRAVEQAVAETRRMDEFARGCFADCAEESARARKAAEDVRGYDSLIDKKVDLMVVVSTVAAASALVAAVLNVLAMLG